LLIYSCPLSYKMSAKILKIYGESLSFEGKRQEDTSVRIEINGFLMLP